MPLTTNEGQAFAQIEEWASTAIAHIRDVPEGYTPPPLEPLAKAMVGKLCISSSTDERDERGRTLVSIKVKGPKDTDDDVVRHMLPVHAAITRVLELGGAKVRLIRGSGGGIEKYYFDLRIGIQIRTALSHFLFGVPALGRLWERQETQKGYRYVVPANYILGSGMSRRRTLSALREQLIKKPQKNVVPEQESFITLLSDLLGLADHWHWDELERQSSVTNSERFTLDVPYA